MNTSVAPLLPEQLRWYCDPDALGFETTEEVPPVDALVGQERGLDAIELGLNLDALGYNVYVAGPTGTGRSTAVHSQLRRLTEGRPASPDFVYLHNFSDPYEPMAVQLPAGDGPRLAHGLDQFITTCRRDIPKIFQSERYEAQRLELVQSIQQRRDSLFNELQEQAEEMGFVLQFTPGGILSFPTLTTGQPISSEAFDLLTDDKKAEFRALGQQLQHRIDEAMVAARRIEREGHVLLHQLDRETALFAVGHLLDELRQTWSSQPAVVHHVDAIRADLVEHLDEFRVDEEHRGMPPFMREQASERYRANVLVTHPSDSGPPVVVEPNPTYYNLLGRIDYRAAMGAMHTDFTLINAGALHRANGGYLVLQARDVLLSPFAWDALKRSLRDREVRVENLGEQFSAFPSASLKPQPISLQVKVVLIGDLTTYMLLYRLDDDFRKLFKVKAQFGHTMEHSADSIHAYAGFINSQVRECGLLPFEKGAVAAITEYGARLAEHQGRLSSRLSVVAELVTEAGYLARRDGGPHVTATHVARALGAQEHRVNLFEDETQRLIDEHTIVIDTVGAVVGQINGLSVLDLGDYAFARPSRITAQLGIGGDGVVNIEREVQLSGPSHSKGVLILTGYLLGKYAREHPLALSARLVFEQVYGEVDGDSASSTELYALLSALSDLPIRQGIAVTGSVNQFGDVQAIGGATIKIEGFFAACQAGGLTGDQGVIIPQANVPHLMLKPAVIDAVAQGQFHIWAVRTIDEGIELLTGVPAGERRSDGSYAEGTVHERVQKRLTGMAERLARYGQRRPRSAAATPKVGAANGKG